MARPPDPIKATGKKHGRRAYAVHHDVVNHPCWAGLSVYAKLLWLEIGLEYFPESRKLRKAGNNGWLACPYKYLIAKRGFRSRSTIKEALNELQHFGFLVTTYPGSFPSEPARYRLTHLDSDTHPDHNMRAERATHDYRHHDGSPFVKRSRKKTRPTVPLASTSSTAGGTVSSATEKHSPARGTRGNAATIPKPRAITEI